MDKPEFGEGAGTEIVAYCRGSYCVYADDAVRELADDGRQALRLEEGFPEWRAAGLPVEPVTVAPRSGRGITEA
ncbi:hypothetical protein [Arthrobacter pascens]|uniref:hypothetical protein n=1 Tax=Arthrobacter pascens TaxID=1677 RepID=UPI00196B86C5|nr:hypothetical protein [Arthrobacter pascens]MBN3498378.1 hypothetical protein [Arthrobacter pascens]